MTERSAYRLADAPGADSFMRAWDMAIDDGMAAMRMDGLDRSLNGEWVPIYRDGKLFQVELAARTASQSPSSAGAKYRRRPLPHRIIAPRPPTRLRRA